MPKSKVLLRDPKRVLYSRKKFKIGGRGSTKSALDLTNDELLAALNSGSTRGRDKNKIRQVLQGRGITEFTLTQEATA